MSKTYCFDKKTFTINNRKFDLDWEKEVITEFKTYEYIRNRNLPCDYIAYPWALLLDLYCNKFRNFFSTFYFFLKNLNLLDNLPKNKKFITTIQSYHFDKCFDCFKKIGIKYIFCPHITKDSFLEVFKNYDIIVFPYYIYPSVRGNDNKEKQILYNFIGNTKYSLKQPTIVRTNIANLVHNKNSIIKAYNKWHFDDKVYGEQLKLINHKNKNIIEKETLDREIYYKDTMERSKFTICPLGIGPNSIRLWESFTYNSIPISISDNLWLPFYIDVDWNKLIINIKEENYTDLLNVKNLENDTILKYQEEIKKFNNEYLVDSNFGNIIEKAFEFKNKFILLTPWYNIIDNTRYQEIHTCLGNNLDNNLIKEIVLFYEVSNINEINFNKYCHPKIKIIPIITDKKRDISINKIIEYINNNLINELCIISNNDIYFDSTLSNIEKFNFYNDNYFLALTRKNCDKYLDSNNKVWRPHSASQDTWIFKSPIHQIKKDINLGWIQCDNIIAASYCELGYNVVNPHYDINCWHLHKYNNTNHLLENYNYNYLFPMKKVPLENIDSILSNKNSNIQAKPKSINRINTTKLSKIKKCWIEKNS